MRRILQWLRWWATPRSRRVDVRHVVIGQYADYLHYDPDGITGEPTPYDPEFEKEMFPQWILDAAANRKAIREKH